MPKIFYESPFRPEIRRLSGQGARLWVPMAEREEDDMGMGLSFQEFVELKLKPPAGADRAFFEAAERERRLPMRVVSAANWGAADLTDRRNP